MGGQSVIHWAKRFLQSEPALRELEAEAPLLSKDVDFQGDRDAAIAFARALNAQAEVPDFRHAFGNLMAGKFVISVGGAELNVEVLRNVPGLTSDQVIQFSTLEQTSAVAIRVLNPVGVVMAKAWNVVNITKEGRHDFEQMLVALVCLRAFFRSLLQHSELEPSALRPALKLVEAALRFTELPAGRKTAEKCGVDWAQIVPHNFIAAATRPELVRFREKRLPGWLAHLAGYRRAVPASETHRKMLAILVRHAEPLCVDSSFAIRKSKFR
ncbi:MAG: hypothetical protein EBS05_07975 [Proteobacteria bacterium]|nr:hypothetical protein [Pseudomonadota bacterium]